MSGRTKPLGVLAAALMILGLLAACTGPMPLYGDAAATPLRYSFTYGVPSSRSDQVIYRELRLRLPQRNGAEPVTVSVASSASARRIANTTTAPYEMMVSAYVTVTKADGTVVFSGTRTASAAYNYVSQVLADNQAAAEAVERASIAVAETIRLTIASALARS